MAAIPTVLSKAKETYCNVKLFEVEILMHILF